MLVIAGDIGGLYSMDLNPTNLEAATLRANGENSPWYSSEAAL